MKNTLLVTLILAITMPLTVTAQNYAVDKGVILAGGTVSFSSAGGDLNESDGERATSLLVNPTVGFFAIPNLSLALELLYASESEGDFKITAIGFGPQVAYYFGNSAGDIFPFISASFMRVSADNHVKETQMNITLAGGATRMVAKNIGITGKVFYTMESNKVGDADAATKGNKYGIAFGISTFIF